MRYLPQTQGLLLEIVQVKTFLIAPRSVASRLPLILELRVVLADQISTDARLEVGDDLGQALVTHLLKLTEDAGLEEDLGVTDTVVVAKVKGGENLLRGDLAVDERASRDSVGSEDGVSKREQTVVFGVRTIGTM